MHCPGRPSTQMVSYLREELIHKRGVVHSHLCLNCIIGVECLSGDAQHKGSMSHTSMESRLFLYDLYILVDAFI